MCEEGGDGSLADSSTLGLQVTEAHIEEGEVEGCVGVHHLVEELYGHGDQLGQGITVS